jgi:hypothetical protein
MYVYKKSNISIFTRFFPAFHDGWTIVKTDQLNSIDERSYEGSFGKNFQRLIS